MTAIRSNWKLQALFSAGLWFLVSYGAAAEPKSNVDPVVKRYLDCINGAARNQQSESSDKISSAQTVVTSCEREKQALLKERPGRKTEAIVAKIEQHLRSRERK
jgi:hypothetical protein